MEILLWIAAAIFLMTSFKEFSARVGRRHPNDVALIIRWTFILGIVCILLALMSGNGGM